MEQNFLTVGLPLPARLYRVCKLDDLDAAHCRSAYLLACQEAHEPRDEERGRGATFTRLAADWESDCSRKWCILFVDGRLRGMAWLGVRWKIPLTGLALSLGYSWIESAIMAGVELVLLEQQTAQRLIIALCDRYV